MKNKFNLSVLTLSCLMILCSGCEDDEGGGQVVLPTGLTLTLTQTGDNGEVVGVAASASNTNFYRINFGDGSPVIENQSGEATHTYTSEGTFEITVQAHTTIEAFISESQEVTIEVPDPTELGYISPESYDGYELVWRDEFTGSDLSSDWTYEIGDGCPNLCGWGNNELEYYRRENTQVTNGFLYITAKRENYGGRNYTSSRIITKDKQEFEFGRVDIRAVLPEGQGIWPALWMLGSNIDQVSWPACGEIDIMEMVGGSGRENTVHGTIHWDNNGQYASYGGSVSKTDGTFSDKFHVYSIVWNESRITWLVDNEVYHEVDITPESLGEFRNSFFLIFNVAVGGNWPGSPTNATSFPQEMIVDYVRVFQEP